MIKCNYFKILIQLGNIKHCSLKHNKKMLDINLKYYFLIFIFFIFKKLKCLVKISLINIFERYIDKFKYKIETTSFPFLR